MRVGAPPPPGFRNNPALKQKYLQDFQFASEVSKAVGAESDACCLDDRSAFNPLRAGSLKLTRLRVLDAYGQVRDLIGPGQQGAAIRSPEVILAGRLSKGLDDRSGNVAVLPLRYAQPARLSFRYRAANDDTNDLRGPR